MPSNKNHQATLQVDTTQLKIALEKQPPEKITIDGFCQFKENPGKANEDFLITADVGDSITWTGEIFGADSTGEINIVGIIYEKGTEVFSNLDFDRDNGKKNKPMKARGKIEKTLTHKHGDNENYKIFFSYTDGPGNYYGTWYIDPKLEINT